MAIQSGLKKYYGPGWLAGILLLLLSLSGCDGSPEKSASPPARADGFTFLGVHADSVLNGEIRDSLKAQLGSAAVETDTTLDLTTTEGELPGRYLPDLSGLNRRLNYENGIKLRIEHPTIKLIYRYSSLFKYVELFFTRETRRPLLFRIRAEKDGSRYIDTFQSKYGASRKITWPQKKGRSFIWKQDRDVLILSLYADQYDNPQFEILICYTANIEAMIAANKKKPDEPKRADKGPSIF